MIYTTSERNKAILSVANGNADLTDVDLFERLASFNWVYLTKESGVIKHIDLTYAAKNLLSRLSKQNS